MLSQEDNEMLARVGPGTPMGELLRRYWMPACLGTEVLEPGAAPLRVRLLGEDLVAFRDLSGRVGLVAEHCPHRGASLYFGRNELGPAGACGLRCVYHGWQFDVEGNCIDVPSEPAGEALKRRVALRSYPTHESGGIVWTYMGPTATLTPFRDFGTDGLRGDQVYATKQVTTCNWVQVMEGNIDTAHISHLHQFNAIDDIPDDGSDHPGYPSNAMSWKFWRHDRSPRLEVEDTWYGFRYAGLRTTPNGHDHARVVAWIMPNSNVGATIPFNTRQTMVVPIDDHTTWRYLFVNAPRSNPRNLGGGDVYAVRTPFSTPLEFAAGGVTPRRYTADNEYGMDREAQRTVSFTGVPDFGSQDYMVTESMGPIYDRRREHLGTTDLAVIRMRSLLLNAAKALGEGEEPPAVGAAWNYHGIRGAEKILEPGEDWRILGTDDDPIVREALDALSKSD